MDSDGLKRVICICVITLIFVPVNSNMFASAQKEDTSASSTANQESSLNPGDIIFDHIEDAYQWHVFTYKHNHISIPLPVIVYSRDPINSGLHIFWSSRFGHDNKTYKHFTVASEGQYEGKLVVVKKDNSGNTVMHRPYLDLSITKDAASILFSVLLLIFLFVSVAQRYKKHPKEAPRGLQNAMEPIIVFIRDEIAIPSIGKDHYHKYMGYLLTVFFFILFTTLLGLIPIPPGGANITGNLTITLVLAGFTFLITTFTGNKYYWKEIFNPDVPLLLKFPLPLMPIIEFITMLSRNIVLMIRLFANVLGGHIVFLSFIVLIFLFGNINVTAGYGVSLVSVLFSVFITFLEILEALIQTYVFTILSAIYFGFAKARAH